MSEVVYLSKPAPVRMGDEWFDLANTTHFYTNRRFDVLRRLTRDFNFHGKQIGEIGCGSGLVQKQFEEHYGVTVDGFDLHAEALRSSLAERHARFCYNVFDRDPRFAAYYDVMIMFDVLEHIEQETPFLQAALFHVKPGGLLLINVPALMAFYSAYDKAVGHVRRYTMATLRAALSAVGLKQLAISYWGFPLIPILILRKFLAARDSDPGKIIQRGFRPPGRLVNCLFGLWSTLEPIPQQLLGTSVMATCQKP